MITGAFVIYPMNGTQTGFTKDDIECLQEDLVDNKHYQFRTLSAFDGTTCKIAVGFIESHNDQVINMEAYMDNQKLVMEYLCANVGHDADGFLRSGNICIRIHDRT